MEIYSKDQINSLVINHNFIIVDRAVAHLHFLQEDFSDKRVYFVDRPEFSKNLENFEKICDFFLDHNISRFDTLLVIGGGATSDLAGFVASTILRGIKWKVVPTTLLSMVDAAIGGKVGVNSRLGKNLIGNFHLPQKVYIATEFLSTLDEYQIDSGKGEILKYAFLDEKIKALIYEKVSFEKLIKACADYKNKIVKDDFKEEGKRVILNFGHTFGHAIEKITSFSHGISVVMGIKLCLTLFTPSKLKMFDELTKLLEIKVPSYQNISLDEILSYMSKDKKNKNSKIAFIVNRKLVYYSLAEVKKLIRENCYDDIN
ncbi:MAG: 3-dehydroquinate synthase [Bacteriovoracaceae bacterium]|jgi:3-dehydroquinate synthase|nr:3-dehydroquinate synthase [Bacteriovoracaceae bacterium]